jgi:hypothetical protein
MKLAERKDVCRWKFLRFFTYLPPPPPTPRPCDSALLSSFSKERKLGVYLPTDCLANHAKISQVQFGCILLGCLGVFGLSFGAQITLYAELFLELRAGNPENPLLDTTLSLLKLGLGDVVCFEWFNENYVTSLGFEFFSGEPEPEPEPEPAS